MDNIPEISVQLDPENSNELPPLPTLKEDSAWIPKPNNNMRRKSSVTAKMLKSSEIRRQSVGAQRLISDFIAAAGMDYSIENISSNASKKMDEIAANFVPHHVRTYCEQRVIEMANKEKLEPMIEETFGAVVLVDVSGYSKLTAALAEKGPIGAELLSKSMKGYLDKIIQTILAHGGDIVKFAGDAVIFYWRIQEDINGPVKDTSKGEIVVKAAQCCLDLLCKLGTYDIDIPDCATKMLKIHLGIGAGPIYEVHVGGSPGRWEFFIAGDGVNQLGTVLDLAKAGELAVSHQALKYFSLIIDIDTMNIGNYDKRCIILNGLEKARRKLPMPEFKKPSAQILNSLQLHRQNLLMKHFVDQTALFKIEADLIQSQLFGIETNLTELLELIELRQVTTVFIKIGDLQLIKGTQILTESQRAIQIVQTALYHNEGTLRQIHVDDKGAVILCFFGLPPMAHENDSSLGVKAALEIKNEFLDIFKQFSIGIATGVVAFGGIGCKGRTEYAVMGDSINMAARLMCHPEASQETLCDEKTFNLCQKDFEFKPLGETKVKGKNQPIRIFRPVDEIYDPSAKQEDDSKQKSNSEIIGRMKEKNAIKNVLAKLVNKDMASILILEADGGQGLSALYDFTKQEAQTRGCHYCCGIGAEIEKHTPYFIFRSILSDLFGLIEKSMMTSNGTLKIAVKSVAIAKATIEQAPWLEPEEDAESYEPPVDGQSNADKRESLGFKVPNSFVRGISMSFKRKENQKEGGIEANPSPTLVEVPAHTNVKKKSLSEELLAEEEEASQKHADLMRQQQMQVNALFSNRARNALEKIGELKQGSVLNLVMPSLFPDQEGVIMMSRKQRLVELCQVIQKLINSLTIENNLIMCIKEAQYMDSLSWELLLEILSACPKLSLCLLTRKMIENDQSGNRPLFLKIKNHPKATSLTLEGLTKDETLQLILNSWDGPRINTVEPNVLTEIYKKSDGKPLFIRSLVTALKESGQWRILENGALTTQGHVDLGLSFDDRNIVLSQIDHLDRTFQLFLKIAAVIGQKFLLEDVLYFLTGLPGIFSKIDVNNLTPLIHGIELLDKYGFLKIQEDEKSFAFKSSVVRQFVYSLMVLSQRQQLHLKVAKYLEGKMNEQNLSTLLLPVYEHYMESNDSEKPKKLHYLEQVARLHFKNETMHECVKCYQKLLSMTEHDTTIDKNIIAEWTRLLGISLLMCNDHQASEMTLLKAVEMLDYPFPPQGLKFEWELKKQLGNRQKWDKNLCNGPMKEDYIQSYKDFRGSAQALNISEDQEWRCLSKMNAILSFLGLADCYKKTKQTKCRKLALLMGANLNEEMPKTSIYSKIMSHLAYMTFVVDENLALAIKYMDVAESYDRREKISDSILVVQNSAHLQFMSGNWADSKRKFDALVHLGNVSHDLYAMQEGIKVKAILFFLGNSRPSSLGLSRELYKIACSQDDWDGQFWGSFLININLLYASNEFQMESQNMIQQFLNLWAFVPKHLQNEPVYLLCRQSFQALTSVLQDPKSNCTVHLTLFSDLLESVESDDWIAFIPCLLVYHAFIISYLHDSLLMDTNAKTIVNKICDSVHKITKQGVHQSSLAIDFKHFFKGFKSLITKKWSEAERVWVAGVESEGKSDAIYLQALFNISLAKFHEKKSSAEQFLLKAKTLLNKVGAANELSKVWNV